MKVFKIFQSLGVMLICILSLMNNACKTKSTTMVCDNEKIVELGKNYYKPLIQALENYKADNKNFPQNLSQLTPKYISSQVITAENTYNAGNLSDEIETRFEAMKPESNSYVIRFYFQSSSNCRLFKGGKCSYYGDSKSWNCE